MQYLHVRNIEKYQPGYTDRKHIWAKIYWETFLDEAFQSLCEIDRFRFWSLIIMEVYTQKPVPLTPTNVTLLGWDDKKRAISLSVKMLHTLIELRNEDENKDVTQSRVEESRVEESRVEKNKWVKPTPDKIAEYAKTIDFYLDGQAFVDFYESKGWMIGKNKMTDWKAAVRTWKKNRYAKEKNNGRNPNPENRDGNDRCCSKTSDVGTTIAM